MLRLQKIAVTVDEARPSAFLLEEAPYSVHAAALDRTFNHKAFTLEEVAISVEFELGIGRVAEFYRTGFLCNPLGGGKLRAARLFHESLKLGHCEQHIFVMLGGVFDRIFGDIRSGESEVFDAVSFVIRDVEVFVLAVVYRICVAADAEVKSVGALSDDNDAFVSDRAEYISVVLEVGHVDPVRGIASDREVYVIGIWNITHTEVNEKHQGQGIAKKLVENVMENAKRLNKSIEATCSYAKKVIEKNKSEVD